MTEEEKQNFPENIISETAAKVQTELQPDDWLCIMCSKKIASDKDKFFYKDQTEFQFKNSEGYIFDIITFGTADGCRKQGEPTMEFTWFPGHSWTFALCSRCSLHLGWKYSGRFSFYGLIKSRLIKGSTLFN